MNDTIRRLLALFLPSAGVGVLACLIAFALVQQDLRQGADDPQHELAEDAVAVLDTGASPASLVTGPRVDIATSLDPFVAVYDPSGAVLATNGILDGRPPVPPAGVLATAAVAGMDTVTWQPRAGVRSAIVVLRWSGGTVLVGRSLRRVEEMVSKIQGLALAGAGALVVLAAIACVIAARLWPRTKPRAADPGGPPGS